MLNVTGPENTVNYRGFCRHAHPTARSKAGAQLCWPICWLMLAYVGLCWPMLAYLAGNVGSAWSYVDPAWSYVGLSWRLCGPILRPLSADLEAYVGPCWPVRSQKIRKMGTAKKHSKTQDILRVGGLSWSYVGPSWGYVGPSWGYVGPSSGLCWPILELGWPILGLCWPILGLCWPILRPMLAHLEAYLGPCLPILNHKIRKMGKNAKSTKHRKTQDILAGGRGRRQGARPLSPTERRETPSAMPRRGPLAGFMRLTPDNRAPAKADPSARAGFEFDPGGSHLGRGCAYLGLGWRHLGGFTK